MADPITIAVEPVEAGKALYLPLAADASDQDPQVKIVLRLKITNNTPQVINVNAIEFSFPGSAVPDMDMPGIPLVLDPDGPTTPAQAMGAIQPGQTATWSNGRVDLDTTQAGEDWRENPLYLPAPAPPKIKVSVSGNGFSASITLDLAPYTSPTPAGAFLFPFSAADLDESEYPVTSAWHWANGGAMGTQIFAHDISMEGYDPHTHAWSELNPFGDRLKNEDYRIWDKPIRAVADGEVLSLHEFVATNTITTDGAGKLQFPIVTDPDQLGNYVWIQHGDVKVVYCHLQHPLDSSLKITPPPGQPVKVAAGQTLGKIGNSGRATNPHTHILCQRDDVLRGMPFRNAWVLDKTRFRSGNVNDLWVRLKGEGIPFKSVAIWPGVWPPGRPFFEATIDILARILRGDVYAKWRSPNPPPVEFLRTPIEEAVQTMTKDEKKQALEQVRIFQDYGKLLEQILNKALGQK